MRLVYFTRQDIADAIEARGALEGLAAGLAARRVSDPGELDRVRRIQAELVAATASFCLTESPTVEQMAGFGELNLAFHQALIALAKSPMLQLAVDRVQSIAFASPAAVVTPADQAVIPGRFASMKRFCAPLRRAMLCARRNSFVNTRGSHCGA
jgi:GntR family transcriptional regulator of vanillate catabolism